MTVAFAVLGTSLLFGLLALGPLWLIRRGVGDSDLSGGARALALGAGGISSEQGERLSHAQRIALIFQAGLSTAQEVTAISGRGVGMDVVRANIERIGGVVDIESKLGQGVRLTLRVPLTLTIIPALTVSVGGHNYAIPRSAIAEIVRSKNTRVTIASVCGEIGRAHV